MLSIHRSTTGRRLLGAFGLLGAALLFACSEAAAPRETVPVASLSMQGVPASAILVDSTTQLYVIALNSAGSVISDAQVSWASSDEAIATVSQGGLVKGRGAGRVTITASAGDQKATAVIDVRASMIIGPAGGTFTLLNGQLVISVPANVVPSPTLFTVGPVSASLLPADSRVQVNAAISLWPAMYMPGTTVTKRYDPAAVPAGGDARALQLFTTMSSNTWSSAPSTVDTVARTVRGTVTFGGNFAVGYTPVDHIAVDAGSGFALVQSQATTLSAVAYDARNAVLTNRAVSWTSSNTSVASVDATGKVTAIAPGTATITATAEGKQGTAGVTVLARPTPDWSSVTEWQTYQGNAGHTGFVPVTADPSVFKEKWVATPFGTTFINPVSTAPGAVFVSSNGSPKGVASLDAATGVQRWKYDVTADGLDAPANANGNVFVQSSGHSNSFLWSFDAATGALRFRSAYENQWSRYYAPVVDGGALYMAGGYYDGMYSFTTDVGTQRWFAATNQYDSWSPAVRNGLVYAYTGSYSPKVIAVDAATGVTSFEIADPQFSWSGWSMNLAPALGDANDLLATNGGRLISFDLQAHAIGWQQTGGFTGSVTVGGGQLFVIKSGQLEIRSEATGDLIGVWVPPQGQAQAPVLATRNLVFVSTATATYAVDIASRRTIWSYPGGGALALGTDGILYISQSGGKLAAIALK